jgi:hypothetical protein
VRSGSASAPDGITLVNMGAHRNRVVEKAVALQALFVMEGGVVGASHGWLDSCQTY